MQKCPVYPFVLLLRWSIKPILIVMQNVLLSSNDKCLAYRRALLRERRDSQTDDVQPSLFDGFTGRRTCSSKSEAFACGEEFVIS